MLLSPHIAIRPALAADQLAVMRLAALDSQSAPAGPLLLAEQDGELVAALSLASGRVIADPFRRTAHLAELLKLQAAALATPSATPARGAAQLRPGRPGPARRPFRPRAA